MPLIGRGIDVHRTAVDLDTGHVENLVNASLSVTGEVRRRKGMARTNVVKKNNAVNNLQGFSTFASTVMLSLIDDDALQGYESPRPRWGTASWGPETMRCTDGNFWDGANGIDFAVHKNCGNHWITHVDIWAKPGDHPAFPGDGTFVGTYPIERYEYFIFDTWTSAPTGDWFLSSNGRSNNHLGPMCPLTSLTGAPTFTAVWPVDDCAEKDFEEVVPCFPWVVYTNYSLDLTQDAIITVTAPAGPSNAFSAECRILEIGADTPDWEGFNVVVTATVDGARTKLEHNGGGFAFSQSFPITNYAGAKYGFLSATMKLEVDDTNDRDTATLTYSVCPDNLFDSASSTIDS